MEGIPESLSAFFQRHSKLAVALSGGVDSAYLLYAATRCGADVRAYFAHTAFQPAFECEDAQRAADFCNIRLERIRVDVLGEAAIACNGADRCYHCKRRILGAIKERIGADAERLLLDGTNASDDADDRPGMRALSELGVRSPLRICGLKKTDVRALARRAGIPVADKPAYACLATRVQTGMRIEAELLCRIEAAELALMERGYRDFRVRIRPDGALLQFTQGDQLRAHGEEQALDELLGQWFEQVRIDHVIRKGSD